jgi:hypothetical protein
MSNEDDKEKTIEDNKEETTPKIKNPFIDAVHNGKFSQLKDEYEKKIAVKIVNRIETEKSKYMDKITGR